MRIPAWRTSRIFVVSLVIALGGCITPAAHLDTAPPLASGDGVEMVQVRGAWLRVRETPPPSPDAGPPVVFVHGFGSRLESFRIVQPALATTHQTLSYDQRGYGFSERLAGSYGPEAHAADLLALLDQRHIERAVLVGHSYGAGVVLRFALRHPERVAGIVLVSPFALDEQLVTAFRWAQVPGLGEYLFAASWRGFAGEKYLLAFHDPLKATSGPGQGKARFVSAAVLDEVEGLQTRAGSTYAQLATVRGMDYVDVQDSYRLITAPIQIVWGQDDRITPFSLSQLLLTKLPTATLVSVPHCGHMPTWEHPLVVQNAVAAVSAHAVSANAVDVSAVSTVGGQP